MRKSLWCLILSAIFIPVILAGCGKPPEIPEPTSSETSFENEITQDENQQGEPLEEVSPESTEPNEKIEVASSEQTDVNKNEKQIATTKNTKSNKATQTAPTRTKEIEPTCQHNFIVDSEQAASCTASGTKVHKCTNCGQVYQEELPAHGHNFVEVANSAPTCTNGGSRTMRCTHCGQEYSEQTADPLGHAFSGWTINENYHSRSCSRCGHAEKGTHQLKDSICQVCGVVDFR